MPWNDTILSGEISGSTSAKQLPNIACKSGSNYDGSPNLHETGVMSIQM